VTLLSAALLGIVQGVTEFLPISSTAHLLLIGRMLGYSDPGGVFTVMIQLGSILAVVWLYRAKIVSVVAGLGSTPEARHFALAIVMATIPALVAGAFLAGFVKTVLYESPAIFAVAFIVGGLIMLAVDRRVTGVTVQEADQTPLGRALGIGVCQTLALVPGVSRSGATIVGGVLAGLSRPAAAEFSFFLAIPTMTAAFLHDLFELRSQLSPERSIEIGVGLVMAFVSSLLVMKSFLLFLRKSGFAPFAWYRIAVGVALLVAVAAGWLNA
jgi:undecaprenyl-diphosphatase